MSFKQKKMCNASALLYLQSPICGYDKKFELTFFTGFYVFMLMLMLPSYSLAADTQDSFDHNHLLFSEVLSQHVTNGLVNYRAIKANPSVLDEYLQELTNIDPDTYEKWTRDQKLALWINAYNAFTIKAILDHYPIDHSWLADPLGQYPDNSIRQIKGVWDTLSWPIMGKAYTLNHIEHTIIRHELVEPKSHFVLVCASIGCPYLENQAFGASDLETRLEQAGINYIYESRRLRIDRKNKIVQLPQIFKWFEEDFEAGTEFKSLFKNYPPKEAGILSWVYRFANPDDRESLKNNTYKIVYLYYDWSLNEQP